MAQIMNFKRLEVSGVTKEEALAKAPFFIQGDATQAYRNARKAHIGAWTDADMKQFMLNYLGKKSKNAPGSGYYITVESAVADSRQRPYTCNDVKNEKGARKWKTIFQVYENLGTENKPVRGELLIENAGETKSEAKAAAKALYTDMKLNKNVVCYYTKQVVEGEAVAFTMDYTPSSGSHPGVYIVFGVENA